MDESNNQTRPPALQTLGILWFALLVSQALLVLVAWINNKDVGFRMDHLKPDFSNPINIVLPMMGFTMFAVSIILPKIVARNAPSSRNENASLDQRAMFAQTPMIIGCALAESTTLIGFVIAFIAHEPAHILPFVALGLYSHFLKRPTPEFVDSMWLLRKNQ